MTPDGSDPAAAQVLLRMEIGGGFVPIGFVMTQHPQFTLYADGSAIYEPPAAPGRPLGPVLAPLRVARLDDLQRDALLGFALQEGGLANARPRYETTTVADAPTTTFLVNAAGIVKSVKVDALSEEQPAGPDAPARRALLKLSERLRDFAAEVAAGGATDAGPYVPTRYRAHLVSGAGVTQAAPIPWPWKDVAVDDFAPAADGNSRLAVLTAEQAALVAAVPNSGVTDLALSAPDGMRYSLFLRPLLPDDTQ